jgi:membrane protein
MVIAAQALFALVPLVVVLVALMPDWFTQAAVECFQGVTGLTAARQSLLGQAEPATASSEAATSSAGVAGVVITIVSASSFARAVMRAYERVWDLPYLAGVRGRLRRLWWLLGWLAGLYLVALPAAWAEHFDSPLLVPAKLTVQAVLATVATWLIGGGIVLVASAILGHVLVEDRWTSALAVGTTRVVARYVPQSARGRRVGQRPGSGPGS